MRWVDATVTIGMLTECAPAEAVAACNGCAAANSVEKKAAWMGRVWLMQLVVAAIVGRQSQTVWAFMQYRCTDE